MTDMLKKKKVSGLPQICLGRGIMINTQGPCCYGDVLP